MTSRPRRSLPRSAIAAVVAVLTVGAAGAAVAQWFAPGSGAGTGTAGTTTAVTLSPGSATADLYPGSTSGVVLTISNPNSSNVHLSMLAPDTTQGTGGFAVDAAHSTCDVSSLGYPAQTNGGIGWNVPARTGGVNGTLSVTLPNALTMAVSASNGCQGASFTVYLTSS